jgi:hypothetical protein
MAFGPILACRADILLAMGDLKGSKESALGCLSVLRQPGRRRLGVIARSTRTLALAEARVGQFDSAFHELAQVLMEVEVTYNPVIIGGLHETAARVALLARDPGRYAHHCQRAQHYYRPTQNPVLIGRFERLVDAGQALERSSPSLRPVWEERLTQFAVTQIDGE